MNMDQLNADIAKHANVTVYLRPTAETDAKHCDLCYGLFYIDDSEVEKSLDYWYTINDKQKDDTLYLQTSYAAGGL